MDKILVNNNGPLHGEVQISTAKNAVLPILAATLLTKDTCTIEEVPNLRVNRLNQMILTQEAQSRVPGALNIRGCPLLQFFTGKFQKLVGKHPVSGGRHVQRIAHVKEDHFLVFQQIEHILSPLMKCIS